MLQTGALVQGIFWVRRRGESFLERSGTGKGNLFINHVVSARDRIHCDPLAEAQEDKLYYKLSPVLMQGDCPVLLYPYASESQLRCALAGCGRLHDSHLNRQPKQRPGDRSTGWQRESGWDPAPTNTL